MIEKYGFVYLWRDTKRKMYYVGCHWGSEDDGYICSSNRMRDAYKRRQHDFKRRVISRVYKNRTDLLEEEFRWLSMIKPEELGNRYYNLRQHHYGHWINNPDSRTIRQKISENTKLAMVRPDVREKYLIGLETRYIDLNNIKAAAEHNKGTSRSQETRDKISLAQKGRPGNHIQTDIEKTKRKASMSQYKVSCLCCNKEHNKGNFVKHINKANREELHRVG